MPLGVVDWGPVLAAVIAGVPGTIAAIISARNRKSLKTPNGSTVGELMQDTNTKADVTTHIVKRSLGTRKGDALLPPHPEELFERKQDPS